MGGVTVSASHAYIACFTLSALLIIDHRGTLLKLSVLYNIPLGINDTWFGHKLIYSRLIALPVALSAGIILCENVVVATPVASILQQHSLGAHAGRDLTSQKDIICYP